MLVTCPECSAKISSAADPCPQCGLPDAGYNASGKSELDKEAQKWPPDAYKDKVLEWTDGALFGQYHSKISECNRLEDPKHVRGTASSATVILWGSVNIHYWVKCSTCPATLEVWPWLPSTHHNRVALPGHYFGR